MKKMLVLSVALILAACCQKADTTAEATPAATGTAMAGAPAPAATQAPTGDMAGSYEIRLADGTMVTETINADGTYVDVQNGKETRGTWRMNGAQACFDAEGDAAEVCYTSSPVAADGSWTATAPDGTTATIRKVGAAPAM